MNINQSTSSKSLKGHTDGIYCLKKLNSNKIISGSDDCTLKLWNIDKQVCLRTYFGHTKPVISLIKLKSNKVISGSSNSIIKIWSLDSSDCIKTYGINQGHKNAVFCLVKINPFLFVSSGSNFNLELWNIDIEMSNEVIAQTINFKEQYGEIFSLIKLNSNQVVCGNKSGSIIVRSINEVE